MSRYLFLLLFVPSLCHTAAHNERVINYPLSVVQVTQYLSYLVPKALQCYNLAHQIVRYENGDRKHEVALIVVAKSELRAFSFARSLAGIVQSKLSVLPEMTSYNIESADCQAAWDDSTRFIKKYEEEIGELSQRVPDMGVRMVMMKGFNERSIHGHMLQCDLAAHYYKHNKVKRIHGGGTLAPYHVLYEASWGLTGLVPSEGSPMEVARELFCSKSASAPIFLMYTNMHELRQAVRF